MTRSAAEKTLFVTLRKQCLAAGVVGQAWETRSTALEVVATRALETRSIALEALGRERCRNKAALESVGTRAADTRSRVGGRWDASMRQDAILKEVGKGVITGNAQEEQTRQCTSGIAKLEVRFENCDFQSFATFPGTLRGDVFLSYATY